VTGPRPLAIVGPTGTGKSDLALAVADTLSAEVAAEVVNADAMQLYRGMDIGTAKPTPEEQARCPHHLLNVIEPHQEFSVVERCGAYTDFSEAFHLADTICSTERV